MPAATTQRQSLYPTPAEKIADYPADPVPDRIHAGADRVD